MMDRHTYDIAKSLRRIHREVLRKRVEQAKRANHAWEPDDKKPIIGVNEDPETNQDNPYVVLRDVTYSHELLRPIVITEGTLTDLGSIPWIFKWIPGFRPTDPGRRMFLIHDELYRKQLADRKLADTIMESGLIADGMTARQARLCYLGVRLGGWILYNRYAKQVK